KTPSWELILFKQNSLMCVCVKRPTTSLCHRIKCIMTTEESRSSNSLLAVSFLLFGLFVLNGFVWSFAHPGHLVPHEVRLSGPYSHEQGNAFVVDSPVKLPSDETDFQRSRVELYEAGIRLGPPHSAHAVIRDLGSGAFS